MPEHSETKDKIIQFLRTHGPSLPVHIAKEINQSILFTSAFLSELLSERRLIMSDMRVGSSPVYFLQGQENRLEKYLDNIKGKEKEALLLLKEKKFLKDNEQQPAIRVALRAIKDFAIPVQKDNQIYWRYFKETEQEISKEEKIDIKEEQKIDRIPQGEQFQEEKEDSPQEIKDELNIFDKLEDKQETKKETPVKIKKLKKKSIKKISNKKTTEKANDKFFNKVKEFLNQKLIEISGIEGFSKTDLTLKIKENNEEKILIAYNKKRLTEQDITNAHKKAKEYNLKYVLLSLGELSKKTLTFIDAIRDLEKIEKIEN